MNAIEKDSSYTFANVVCWECMGAKVDPILSHNNTGDGISQQT